MSSDRRRSPRIELLGRMHGQIVSLGLAVTVREMSLGGLSLESAIPFPVGETHEFSLTMGDESAVVLRGQIMYSRPGHAADGSALYVTGVQFVEPEDPPTAGDLIEKIK